MPPACSYSALASRPLETCSDHYHRCSRAKTSPSSGGSRRCDRRTMPVRKHASMVCNLIPGPGTPGIGSFLPHVPSPVFARAQGEIEITPRTPYGQPEADWGCLYPHPLPCLMRLDAAWGREGMLSSRVERRICRDFFVLETVPR